MDDWFCQCKHQQAADDDNYLRYQAHLFCIVYRLIFSSGTDTLSYYIHQTDADTDGAHIQTLLLTFFYRYMRPLVEAGHVYIALPPLYKMSKGKGKKEVVEYAWTDGELEELRQKFGRGAILQRYKGLGEMNADQLWETTMDPETRTLIRVTIDDLARAERRVSVLMGDKAAPRRQWIEDNVKFTLEESGEMVF